MDSDVDRISRRWLTLSELSGNGSSCEEVPIQPEESTQNWTRSLDRITDGSIASLLSFYL